MNKKCTIIVNSCDAYADLWEPFFLTLKEFWKECPYDIVLNTESKEFHSDGLTITSLKLFKNKPDMWGKRFRETLKRVQTEFVICLYDDFILEEQVDQDEIEKCITWLEDYKDVAVFYFSNNIGDNIEDNVFPDFELIPQKKDYKLNSAPAVWRRELLIEFTGEVDTPWAWEFFGSARTYASDYKFYCRQNNKENIYVYNYRLGGAIHRGKWVLSVIEPVVSRYHLDLDLTERGIEDENQDVFRHTLRWKINFLKTGIRMIGASVSIFIFRSIKKKICRALGGNIS